MIVKFMADKLIITFDEYNKIVEKLAIEIHKKYKPTVLVGIMRGAAPILDISFKNFKTTNFQLILLFRVTQEREWKINRVN